MSEGTVPVLEIGGTHVTAALVRLKERVVEKSTRRELDPHADGGEIIGIFAAAARSLDIPAPRRWGLAIPGPFDYANGVGDFRGIGKFDALRDLDIGRALVEADPKCIGECVFVNDGEAFARGEWMLSDREHGRWTVLTLGTGVGSSYLVDGDPILSGPGVPLDGHVHHLMLDGRPIEDTVSRAAMMGAYRASTGEEIDVREIADRARLGDVTAASVFDATFGALGRSLAESLAEFCTDTVVVGGSISRSWDLVEPPLRRSIGLAADGRINVIPARDLDRSALFGAALIAG